MKRNLATKNLITSLVATVLLLYFMIKSPSPKIIFIPFLICSLSMVGKSIARIMNKEKMEFIWIVDYHSNSDDRGWYFPDSKMYQK